MVSSVSCPFNTESLHNGTPPFFVHTEPSSWFKVAPACHLIQNAGAVETIEVTFSIQEFPETVTTTTTYGANPIQYRYRVGTSVIHRSEIYYPSCGDFRSMSHVCALTRSAEMTPQVIPSG